jgi:tetratricopeptide (TPR) repeat protein
MIKSRLKTAIHYLLLGLLASTISTTVMAQRDDNDDRETKRTVAMSQSTYEALQKANELVQDGSVAEGLAELQRFRESKAGQKLSPYETAQTWNLTAYAYYLQERYPQAISAYERVMAQPELPEGLMQSTLKTMAQLQFTIEDYDEALETVKRLMALVPDPDPDVYMLLGQAYIQKEDYRAALDPIKTGVDKYRALGNVPKENWLLLLRVCYFELNDYPRMIATLLELLEHYPKDTYYLTLAGAYSEQGETMKQLAISEALYEKGLITNPAYITSMASLYILHEVPYKAAKLLEKEIEAGTLEANVRNLRMLSQAWYQAREDRKAIPPLEQAAGLSDDGELYVRLAQSYLNLEDWNNAVIALRKGIQMGGVRRNDTANVMLGMALMNLKRYQPAIDAFRVAANDDRSASAARKWINYVEGEIRRSSALEQELPDIERREQDEMLRANLPQE